MGVLASLGAKYAGKALRFVTKGKLLGSGGGRAAAMRVGTGVATIAGISPILTAAGALGGMARRGLQTSQGFGPDLNPFGTNRRTGATFGFGGRSRGRRMNVGNMRALRKSIRRIQGFEKLAREVFTISKGSMHLKPVRRGR
jgi:hypothetical protein